MVVSGVSGGNEFACDNKNPLNTNTRPPRETEVVRIARTKSRLSSIAIPLKVPGSRARQANRYERCRRPDPPVATDLATPSTFVILPALSRTCWSGDQLSPWVRAAGRGASSAAIVLDTTRDVNAADGPAVAHSFPVGPVPNRRPWNTAAPRGNGGAFHGPTGRPARVTCPPAYFGGQLTGRSSAAGGGVFRDRSTQSAR